MNNLRLSTTCYRHKEILLRILFVVPHYYGPGPAHYGSTDHSQRTARAAALRNTIASIRQHLGSGQRMYGPGQELVAVNGSCTNEIDIVVCTTGDRHLIGEASLPPGACQQQRMVIDDPLYLGYSCYDVFRERFGGYDWYCYLEDDLIIADGFFFRKLEAFCATVCDPMYILQPNRYELLSDGDCGKIYIDGPLWDGVADSMARFRLPGGKGRIDMPYLGSLLPMLPAENPHSGCFFLSAKQMEHLIGQPWYGKKITGYAGPLESAATLFILALFHVFKPAPECAAFLEIHHAHQRYTQSS